MHDNDLKKKKNQTQQHHPQPLPTPPKETPEQDQKQTTLVIMSCSSMLARLILLNQLYSTYGMQHYYIWVLQVKQEIFYY